MENRGHTVDCSTHDGMPRENDWIGFASDGSEPCRSTADFCPQPVPVSDTGWGDVKGRYR